MKFILLLLALGFSACNTNNKESERLEKKEQELNERERLLQKRNENIDTAAVLTNEYDLKAAKPMKQYVYIKVLTTERPGDTLVWTSGINEVENITDDKKAQLMDAFISRGVGFANPSAAKILARRCLVFDSYAQASEDRFIYGKTFYK